jgi:hexosaminidase
LKDAAELQAYFFKRLKKILETKGKKMMGWDEMLDGGFSDDAMVMNWRTDARTSEIIKAGHTVIIASQEYTYLDHYQGDPAAEKPSFDMLRLKKVYGFEPVPAGLDERSVLGGQGNLWAEFVPEFSHAEYMLWPRAFALSEILWSPKERQNWPDFIQRTAYQLQRLKYAGINYSTSFYDAMVDVAKNKNGKLEIRLDTEIDSLKIYYTFSDKDPDLHSAEYKKGEVLIFPDSAAFCRVVTYKNNQQAGKVIVLPLYELQNRIAKK